MPVFTTLYRYRFLLLLFTLWMIAVLLFSGKSAVSQHIVTSQQIHAQSIVNPQENLPPTVTENVHKTLLENGLTVLTKEVHTAPVVTVQVWYKVGSRNEEPGLNGIAHQLEHMMFKGTETRPIQFGRLFSALGSDSNAFTSYDQTAYYGTAERNKLKALLILEADRMQSSVIDTEQLGSEKRVVISELQGYENSPEYRLNRAVMRAAFPNHAYGLPVGGTKADVEKFTVEQVRKYYQKYYSPDNAVLVIVGDFQTAPTLEVVKEIFGKLPKSQQSIVNSQQSTVNSQHFDKLSAAQSTVNTSTSSVQRSQQLSESPIVLREAGAGELLQVVYPLPDINHPDVPTLDVMDYILTEGRNSRLDRVLIESGLASDIGASVTSLREFGWYELLVTAAYNQSLEKIDSVLNRAIADLVKSGVTAAEVNRAKTQLEAAVILANRDLTNQAMQLGNDETTTGDYRHTERYLAAIRKVTPADVVAVVKKYLKPEARTVGYFEPSQKELKGTSKPNSTQTTENFGLGSPVAPTEVLKYLPPVDEITDIGEREIPQQFQLANGLKLLLLPDRSIPTITLSGHINAGTEFDPEDKAGLASLVADNLMNGTKTQDFLQIAQALEDKGANLEFRAYREGVRIDGDSLAGDLPVILKTLADVVKNSNFPTKEWELERQQALTNLKLDLDDPDEVAIRTFVQSIYPHKHPLHNFPTAESLKKIKRKDAIAFKEKYYRPDNMVLTIVGDFEPAKVRSLLEKEFGGWKVSGEAPKLQYPQVSMPDKEVRVNSILPGKAQAITYMGYKGISRKDPRFYAALVLNQILGGDTLSSRLGAEVRDRQGLTYGIYSYFQVGKNAGTFWIELQTSPEDTIKAIASTQKLLKQIHQQGVVTAEVEAAKQTLISNYNVSLANPEELTKTILMNQVHGLDKVELRAFTDKIQQVTLNQVNQAARELIHPDKIVVATAGPAVLAQMK